MQATLFDPIVAVDVTKIDKKIWISFHDSNGNCATVPFESLEKLKKVLMTPLVKFACEKSGKTEESEK